MTNTIKIKKMTGVGLLVAITVVLTLLGNMITIGPVAINLSLIPITLGAIIYGPISGFILGAANGLTVLLAPSTAIFLSHNVFLTIITCIFKTGLAGLVAGFAFKLLNKVNFILGVVIAAILTPVVNTGIFTICVFAFFYDLLLAGQGSNAFLYYAMTFVGWNFLSEIAISAILSPTIIHVGRIILNKQHLEN